MNEMLCITNKKLILIIVLALTTSILFGCMKLEGTSFELPQPDDEIVSIEIVYVNSYRDIWYDDFEDIEVIETVETEMWQQFLSDFRELEDYYYYNDPVYFIYEIAVRITYSDRSFNLIDSTNVYYYNSIKEDGYFDDSYFDEDSFEKLVNKYLYVS